MSLTATEEKMWDETPTKEKAKMSDEEINQKYRAGDGRILLEINREKLPNFVKSLKKEGYMDLKPFYQRRERWDKQKQSRLIESFLINIPIPPIILYEEKYDSYEVMDGQQRITAIRDFYENKFELTGLKIWPELEGRTYKELPRSIQAGIDRRSISSITIITESTSSREEALFLKQQTFERLNTGGVDLSNQEVRNCLYHGQFNSLLLELAKNEIFVKAWKNRYPQNKKERDIKEKAQYKKMEDVELVLRFFALRNVEHFRGGLKNFLDLYMKKSLKFSEEDIDFLKTRFLETITLASEIYGQHLFKPFDPKSNTWKKRSYKAYYDAVMVGLSRHLLNANLLLERKLRVIEETKKLFKKDKSGLLTGQGKTKSDIQKRIELFDEMLSQVIGE